MIMKIKRRASSLCLAVVLIFTVLVTSAYAVMAFGDEYTWSVGTFLIDKMVLTNKAGADSFSTANGWAIASYGEIDAYRNQPVNTLGVQVNLLKASNNTIYQSTVWYYNSTSVAAIGYKPNYLNCPSGGYFAQAQTKYYYDGSYSTMWSYGSPTVTAP